MQVGYKGNTKTIESSWYIGMGKFISQPLLAALSGVKTPMGTYVVLGNNDYEACYDDIVRGLQKYGMHLLEMPLVIIIGM